MNDNHIIALANERRRDLLRTMISDPSHRLMLGSEPLDRTVTLMHVHLPMLEDAGLIEWDREAQVVTRGPDFDELEPMGEYLLSTAPAEAD